MLHVMSLVGIVFSGLSALVINGVEDAHPPEAAPPTLIHASFMNQW